MGDSDCADCRNQGPVGSGVIIAQRLCVLASLLLAFACAGSANQVCDGPTVRDSAGVRIIENGGATRDSPWRVAEEPSLTIGSVDGHSGQTLHEVTGALRLPDGRIVVANNGTLELRFYDETGELVSRAGGQGGGPGEFLSLELISRFGPDSLLVVDIRSHRVSYFDTEGRFGRSIRLEPNAEIPFPKTLGALADGSLLATKGMFVLRARPPIRTEREEQQLFRYQPDGQAARSIGSFLGAERAVVETGRVTPTGEPDVIRLARRFGRNTTYAVAGSRFYVADNATYEVRIYSADGRLTHLIRKQHTPLAVTDTDLNALQDSVLANESDRILRHAWENRPPPPEMMPAYASDIHLDPNMNLWVREYSRPGDRQWSYCVFDADGIFMGTIAVPNGFAVLDIGRDYVLGLRRDGLDVEYVQLYELRKGS